MIPILSNTATLTGNGLGRLAEALSCIVTHEVNGEYELRMTYPVTGIRYGDLAENLIIWAEPDNLTPAQAFRIYRITRPLNGIVTIYARHIAYDMSGIVVKPFTASTLTTALSSIAPNCSPSCPFTLTSTRTVATQMKVTVPTVLWGLLGGQSGSFLDIYGGEWDFNNYTAELKTTLGTDRGVTVRYGKNLTKLEQDVTIEATYAGVFPFWYDEESGVLVKLTGDYISIPGATGSRLLLLDFSDEWETAPTEVQLQARANAYITANDPGTPKISWKVNMAMLSQSEEFANLAILEQVMLGDTIHVYYEPMNLTASARAVKLEYDVLLERYSTVTLGRVKQNMAQIVAAEKKDTAQNFKTMKSTLEKAIDSATDFITNGAGYMRFIYNSSDELQEIVSLDNADISQAQSVWRWNNGGFGHSSTGYAGPYTLAITQNGAIVADFITAGTMTANRVRAGLLEDETHSNSWNLTTGALTITNGTINITTDPVSTDYIRLNWFNNDQTSMRILELYPGDSSLYGYGRIRMGVRGYNALSPDTYTLTFAEISHNWQGMTYAQEQYVNGSVSSRKTIAQCTANAVSGYWGSITDTGLVFLDPLDPNTVTATYPATGIKKSLTSGDDLNTLTGSKDNGEYLIGSGVTNAPLSWGGLLNISSGSAHQLAYNRDAMYVRSYTGSPLAWKNWKRIDETFASDIKSKNLLKLSRFTVFENYGVKITPQMNGTFKITGVCTTSFNITLGTASLTAGKQYYLSGATGGSSTTAFLNIQSVTNDTGSGSGAFTVSSSTDYGIRVIIAAGATNLNLTFSPMVREYPSASSSFTKWVPTQQDTRIGDLRDCSVIWRSGAGGADTFKLPGNGMYLVCIGRLNRNEVTACGVYLVTAYIESSRYSVLPLGVGSAEAPTITFDNNNEGLMTITTVAYYQNIAVYRLSVV